MKNIIILSLITMITLFLVVNTNYIFADKIDSSESLNKNEDVQSDDQSNEGRDIIQDNYQNNHCRDSAECVNESVSNIFVCEEKSLCLIQYEGPFELLNPY